MVFLALAPEAVEQGRDLGQFYFVSRILSDCDDDTLIYVGTPKGPVCHTGHRTCFFTTLWEKDGRKKGEQYMNSFEQMEAVIAQRRAEPQEGSYTCYLFEKGY